MLYRRSVQERVIDAGKLAEIFNISASKEELWFLASLEYRQIWKRLLERGVSRKRAKDIAWVLTCPRPWDDKNSKPYLSDKCHRYRRWDQFAEAFNNFVPAFFRPFQY